MKVIVIEGVDGSGKETQYNLLRSKLSEWGFDVGSVSFPNYASESSQFVKRYLDGSLGFGLGEEDIYKVSTLYAVDRLITFSDFKLECDYLLMDRYVTSNIVHQGCKFESLEDSLSYVRWLEDFEYTKCGVPKPDLVIYLDVGDRYKSNISGRANKITGASDLDIHERDLDYLGRSSAFGQYISKELGWSTIQCLDAMGDLRSIESIHSEICSIVKREFGGVN